MQALIDECARFSASEYDDQVDALGHDLRRLYVGEVVMPRGGSEPMMGRVLDAMR